MSSASASAQPVAQLARFGRWWFPAWEEQAERHFIRTPRGCQLDHLDAAMRYVRSWECAVDGGAHVGSWALSLAKMFERVLAFEPHPDTYAALVRNLNEAEEGAGYGFHIVALQCGLASRACAAQPVRRNASMSTKLDLREGGGIPCVALDSVPHVQSAQVGFLKLDLEGCEVLALRGARATIARCKPVLLVECKEKNLLCYRSSEAELRALVAELGYAVAEEIEQDLICTPLEPAT